MARSVADGVRGEWPPTTGRPVALAALDDERGAQARTHGAGMTGAIKCRYYGRDFTTDEMVLLRALIAADPQPTRAALSREFCRRIGWIKPDGGLKDMMARVTMLAMHRDGVIALPPPKGRRNPPRPIVFGPDTEPPLFPAPTTLDEVRPLEMRTIVRDTREGDCGTSSSPVTTTSATRPWSAPRCATPSTTATAGRLPCSASPPPPGSWLRVIALSDGPPNCARRTCRWWSTTRGS